MPKIIRKSTFETNSSSAHSIVIPKNALSAKDYAHNWDWKDTVVVLNLKNDDFYGEDDDGVIFNSLKDKLTFVLKDLFFTFSNNHSELYSLPNNVSQCYQDYYFDNVKFLLENKKELNELQNSLKELSVLLKEDDAKIIELKNDIWDLEHRIKQVEEANEDLFKMMSKDFKTILLTKRVLTYEGYQMFSHILNMVKEKTGVQDILMEFDYPIINVPLFGEDYDTIVNGINGVHFWDDKYFNHSFHLNGKKIPKIYSFENSYDYEWKNKDEKSKITSQPLVDFTNWVNSKYLTNKNDDENIKNPLLSVLNVFEFEKFTFWNTFDLPNQYSLPVEFLVNKELIEKFLFNPKSYFRLGCDNGASALDPKLSNTKNYLSIYDDEIKDILKKYDIIYNGSFLDKII